MTALAIDPGMSGGLAARLPDGTIQLFALPDSAQGVARLIGGFEPSPGDIAFVEELSFVIRLPRGEGRANPAAAAKMHHVAGWVEGALAAYQIPIVRVPPMSWQMPLRLGSKASYGGRWKAALRAEAERRYPGVRGLTLKTADALLILDYGLSTVSAI